MSQQHIGTIALSTIALFGMAFISTTTAAADPNTMVVQPAHISDYWIRTNTSLTVDVPNSGVNMEEPTCSAVTFMIGSDGKALDIIVRTTVPAGDLATVAASAVKDMDFAPGTKNGERQPVFTYMIIPFNLPPDPAARKKITDACVLKNFPKGYR